MLIKVCGMREPKNIRAVESLGIDMMGFIFWQGSKRYVSALPDYMPQATVRRVGVFVDAPVAEVAQIAAEAHLWGVQLHGSESADYCRALRELEAMKDVSIIKAIGISEDSSLPDLSGYDDVCTMLLFDAKGPSVGGSGRHFNWKRLEEYHGKLPFILSGGIGPDDVPAILALRHPMMIGIDLNSRFETSPAVKNVGALNAFIKKLKQNERNHE